MKSLQKRREEEAWVNELPYSRMVYPDSLLDRAKYFFWRLYTPHHPRVRDTALSFGIVRHAGRRDFLLGKIAPHLSIREFVTLVTERGYGRHILAWEEDGEVAGLRYVEGFAHQYHLRVFEDKEIRTHYEYTPECHPIAHLMEKGVESRRRHFLETLGDLIVTDA